MATHSSTPAWKIPWMEEPCGLQSMGSQQSNLSCSYFPFSTLNILCHSLLAFRFSVEKSANSLMGTPLDTTFCFSVAACKKSLFIFILQHFNYIYQHGSVSVHLIWDPLCFLNLDISFLLQVENFSAIISLNSFSTPFSFSCLLELL